MGDDVVVDNGGDCLNNGDIEDDNDEGPIDIVDVDNGDCGDLFSDDGDDNDG